jgi:hypothetical protein
MRFIGGLGLAAMLLPACAFAIGYWAHGRKADVARRRRQRWRGRRTTHIDQLMAKPGETEPDQPGY